ncbi:MAG: flagellar hook capping FlgD N-terminal domain-containing protein [Betaproteobacteria bacterium]
MAISSNTPFTTNLSSIKRTSTATPAQQQAATAAAASSSGGMDKTSFLKLFTAQLQNQNPLEPVKNEAFVAQLAQFSQLEATTNMSESLSQLVASIKGDRMMNSSALVGKMVAAPNTPAVLSQGNPVAVAIDLPAGANSVAITILDKGGNAVRSDTLPAQKAGLANYVWDGKDDNGTTLSDGNYVVTASAVVSGVNTAVTVAPMTQVLSVSSTAASADPVLDLMGGASTQFSTVLRVGY